MMLRAEPIGPVPPETARVAQAVFPKGHPYLRLADELGILFDDAAFATLFPTQGQPALAPWRLALVTILQFAEGLSDRQTAHALRSRIDWKYVVRLELTDPGFDGSVLSEFRCRLIEGAAETLLLDTLLRWCRDHKLLDARGRQRTDSTHILASVRALNRIELVGEAMRHALNDLAVVAPAWLCTVSQSAWVERYGRRVEDDRLPTGKEAREMRALTIGLDGDMLLAAIYAPTAPAWLRHVPAVDVLRRIWIQNYYREGVSDARRLCWRTDEQGIPPASIFVSSPYDQDAHYAKKSTTQWVGYKAHITETCDDERPPLITNVETTAGPVADGAVTPTIHAHLRDKGLLPRLHIVDTGFLDASLLAQSSQEYDVDLCGPTRINRHWQARADEGFDVQHFQIDWEHEKATCPTGHSSISWTPALDNRTNEVIKIKFSTKDCAPCPCRSQCTRSTKTYPRRTVTIRRKEAYMALQAARTRERTADFAQEYARRAGIEGTLSRGIRTCDLRRTRYSGLARVHLGHILTAVALNFLRLGEWFADVPRAKTRTSPFTLVMAEACAI